MDLTLVAIAVTVVLVIWYFGRLIKKSLEKVEVMALRRLDRLDHEQKLGQVDYYNSVKVDVEKVKSAVAMHSTLESLQI